MRSSFHARMIVRIGVFTDCEIIAYTCTLRNSILADGSCAVRRTERAVKRAIKNATVVKNPKTFCALTKVECILTRN